MSDIAKSNLVFPYKAYQGNRLAVVNILKLTMSRAGYLEINIVTTEFDGLAQ
jgi:hypothetical protein